MNQTDMAAETVKLAPAAPVTVMTILGYGVDQWASAATLVYVVGLIVHGLWTKVIQPWRAARRQQGG